MRLAAVALGLILSACPAWSGFVNGNTLHEWCKASSPQVISYLMGSYDAYELDQMLLDESPKNKVCLPESVLSSQAADVVCKYVADTPSTRHYPAAALVWNALLDSFPCAASQTP